MKKAIIVAGPGVEDVEFTYPFYRLQEAGFDVDVSTSSDDKVIGKLGVIIIPTIKLQQLNANDYELLIIPGGYEAPDRMRQVEAILALTRDMHQRNKLIASICHGPWVLISAGIMRGVRATCYRGCKDDLVNAGAIYLNEPVVSDGHIVTAQHFRDNPAWMRETLKLL